MLRRLIKASAVCGSLLVLVGCGGGSHQDLQDYIVETKRRPQGQIEP